MRAPSLRLGAPLYRGVWDGVVRRTSLLLCLSGITLICCLSLGGGSRSGFVSDAILQLAALPLLIVALRQMLNTPLSKSARHGVSFCLALSLAPLIQLAPLPPRLWTLLPNSALVAESFQLAGGELPWASISVTPRETWLGALSTLPPLSVFLGVVLLGYRERRQLSLVLLGFGVVSVFLGLLQIANGPESSLRFFTFTNHSEAVGFFANRNHYAAFLYVLTLFAAAWAVELSMKVSLAPSWTPRRRGGETASVVALAAIFAVLVVLVAAQGMARSRAGLALTIIALFGTFALAASDRRRASGVTPAKLLAGVVVVGATFVTQFALFRILDRFTGDPLAGVRISFARNTLEAALAYMPFGSGIGSFSQVYGLFEKPADLMGNEYANHAHNDILEFWLEAGGAGIGLMVVFVGWFIARAVSVWGPVPQGKREINRLLGRSATIAVALLMVHSLVDYPLRTSAMMTVLAFACALLVAPPGGAEEDEPEDVPSERRRRKRRVQPVHENVYEPFPAPVGCVADDNWRQDIAWPEEWRKSSGQNEG